MSSPVTLHDLEAALGDTPGNKQKLGEYTAGRIFEDGQMLGFIHFVHSGKLTPPTGWKVYISVVPSDMQKAFAIIAEEAGKAKIQQFKVADNEMNLSFNNPDNGQCGKNIVLYHCNEPWFAAALQNIERRFIEAGIVQGAPVKNVRRIGNSLYMHYRNDGSAAGRQNYVDAEDLVRLPHQQRYNPCHVADPFLQLRVGEGIEASEGIEPATVDGSSPLASLINNAAAKEYLCKVRVQKRGDVFEVPLFIGQPDDIASLATLESLLNKAGVETQRELIFNSLGLEKNKATERTPALRIRSDSVPAFSSLLLAHQCHPWEMATSIASHIYSKKIDGWASLIPPPGTQTQKLSAQKSNGAPFLH